MLHLITHQAPWYIAGPALGLIVVGMYAVTNKHLGVTGSFVQFVDAARRRPVQIWRLWFLAGLLLGSGLVGFAGDGAQPAFGYGALARLLPLGVLVPFLLFGGTLVGFGARWAGACPSGHGLTGSATRSLGSMVAIAAFVVTGVCGTLVLHIVTGGAL